MDERLWQISSDLVSFVALVALIAALAQRYRGLPLRPGSAWAVAARRAPAAFLLQVMYSLAVLVPALVLFVLGSAAFSALPQRHLPLAAEIALGVLAVVVVLVAAAILSAANTLAFVAVVVDGVGAGTAFGSSLRLVFAADSIKRALAAFSVVYYFDVRVRSEGLDLASAAALQADA